MVPQEGQGGPAKEPEGQAERGVADRPRPHRRGRRSGLGDQLGAAALEGNLDLDLVELLAEERLRGHQRLPLGGDGGPSRRA